MGDDATTDITDAGSGTAAGAAAGSVIPGIGTAIGGLVGGGIGLLGGILQNNQAASNVQATNAYNAQQVQQQEAYQTQMSNTAYQRATADMKAAGINPMLAYMRGGASSPGGGAASAATAPVQNALGQGVSSAEDALRTSTDVLTKTGQLGIIANQVDQSTSSARVARARADEAEAELPSIIKQADYDNRYATGDAIAKRANTIGGAITSALGLAKDAGPAAIKGFQGSLPTTRQVKDAFTSFIPGYGLEQAGEAGIPTD